MSGIAGKDHAPVAKFLHPATLERVNRRPDEFIFNIRSEHGIEAASYIFFFQFLFAIDIPADLEIDPPDIVGLFVQEG